MRDIGTSQLAQESGQDQAVSDLRGCVTVEYEDEVFTISADGPFDIGREADLSLDENPYLHRRFLRILNEHGFWWIVNIGSSTAVTVYDPKTGAQAWLEPTNRLPLIFGHVIVVFAAGPCEYRLEIHNDAPTWQENRLAFPVSGETTAEVLTWTPAQKLVIVALAEPMLTGRGKGIVGIPSNKDAALKIGWSLKRFERKIDNICSKLDMLGVEGMRGGPQQHASGRRVRLVEWAVSTGFVTASDVALLRHPEDVEDEEPQE
ncbi:MAG: hypothetical protein LBN10_01110 [Propionibacteriaceae bacterium]|jgi:hypothetical protein|nr:hypothetical protein [Propionibacteriaceae bacterium]